MHNKGEIIMGKENSTVTCLCGNQIEVSTYHHTGGLNDNDKVILKCGRCGKEFEYMIENAESAKISGATIVE